MKTILATAPDGKVLAKDEQGLLWVGTPDGLSSLEGFNWERFERIVTPAVAGVGTWIASRGQPKQVPDYGPAPQGGAFVGASSSGLFGGVDTTTLLLIGLAAFLFMSKR